MQRSFDHLPGPLQKLVKQLPSKMSQSIGPEVLAAAAEKQGLHSKYTDQAAHAAEKMGMKVRVPTLKDLVTKPGAVAGMLKAIMNFLKLRFPAFLGMNVLYSLALFGMSHSPSRRWTVGLTEFRSLAVRILVLPQTRSRNSPGERPSIHRGADQSHGRALFFRNPITDSSWRPWAGSELCPWRVPGQRVGEGEGLAVLLRGAHQAPYQKLHWR